MFQTLLVLIRNVRSWFLIAFLQFGLVLLASQIINCCPQDVVIYSSLHYKWQGGMHVVLLFLPLTGKENSISHALVCTPSVA